MNCKNGVAPFGNKDISDDFNGPLYIAVGNIGNDL